MPEQVKIDKLQVDIIDKDVGGRSMGKVSRIEHPEPFVDVPSRSGYLAAPAGGAEWSSSLSSITVSDSDDEQLLSTV